MGSVYKQIISIALRKSGMVDSFAVQVTEAVLGLILDRKMLGDSIVSFKAGST